jgi:hypothetical protein
MVGFFMVEPAPPGSSLRFGMAVYIYLDFFQDYQAQFF